MNKRLLIPVIAAGITLLPFATQATGDDGWSCPAGSTFNYKVEPLSGKTFTVPTPPNGWTVTAVILKVGGPGGGTHLPPFTPVTPGQVLSVASQQYDISHAHICKGRTQETTTSTSTTSTTTSTTTTTQPTTTSTTTTTVAGTTTVPTTTTLPSSTSSTPATSTTAPGTTPSTSSPVTSTDPSTTITGGGATTTVAQTSADTTTTVALTTALPKTGGTLNLAIVASLITIAGVAMWRVRRSPA